MGIKEGLVTMPIVKSTFPRIVTKNKMEATRKYAGTARVAANNELLNWVAGIPFPDPKNAQEIAWNAYPTVNSSLSHDDTDFHSRFTLFKRAKYEKYFTWQIHAQNYRGRTDILPLGDMPEFTDRGIIFRESLVIYEPNEVRGFIQVRARYWDLNKEDECYAYIPAIRRVRRLTGADVTDPLLGSDTIFDDFEMWRQKIDTKMTFRVLEQRDFLVIRSYTAMEQKPVHDYKKQGPCFQGEWEIRPHWVLEIMTNNPDYAYAKRILYVDALHLDQGGNYFPNCAEGYDQRGRLWRSMSGANNVANKDGFTGFIFNLFPNCQTEHYTTLSGDSAYDDKNFAKSYPMDKGDLTIRGLLKRVR